MPGSRNALVHRVAAVSHEYSASHWHLMLAALVFTAYPVAVRTILLGWVARRRVGVLILSLVTTVVLQVLVQILENDHAWEISLSVNILLPFALLLASAVSTRCYHPAKLAARPAVPAFDVPVSPGVVLGAAGYTLLGVTALGMLTSDIEAATTDVWFSASIAALWAGLLAAFWSCALGPFGVRLTPDGIVERQVFGSLFVPWDALATPLSAYPHDAQEVALYLAQPELVRRRGLRLGSPALLPAAGVDAELLARAIHEYSNRADLRSAMGSEAELDRLRTIPQIANLANRV